MTYPDLWPQRCKVCGRRDLFNFTVPDEIWQSVVPTEFQDHVVCLACFDSFASMRGIDYAEDLGAQIYFAGDGAAFVLRVIARSSPEFKDDHKLSVAGD